jgi:hypothetical protein
MLDENLDKALFSKKNEKEEEAAKAAAALRDKLIQE